MYIGVVPPLGLYLVKYTSVLGAHCISMWFNVNRISAATVPPCGFSNSFPISRHCPTFWAPDVSDPRRERESLFGAPDRPRDLPSSFLWRRSLQKKPPTEKKARISGRAQGQERTGSFRIKKEKKNAQKNVFKNSKKREIWCAKKNIFIALTVKKIWATNVLWFLSSWKNKCFDVKLFVETSE